MLKTDGPRSLKCQGGIISATHSASFGTLPPLHSERLQKVICTFHSLYVNIWLRIDGRFPWSKISRSLLNLVAHLLLFLIKWNIKAQMSHFCVCLASWRVSCLSHTLPNTHQLKAPCIVNNFKHPGKQTDKKRAFDMKTWQFPSKSLSEKNKIPRERKRLCWQEPTSSTKSALFIIWRRVALWPALGQYTMNYLLQHQNALMYPFSHRRSQSTHLSTGS